MKLTDAAYGRGSDAACHALPVMTVCIDKVAYILARWSHPVYSHREEKGPGHSGARLDKNSWQVFGAYKEGTAPTARRIKTASKNTILKSVQLLNQ